MKQQFEFEQERCDYRAALVASIIAEINRDERKRRKPFTPRDFMPQYNKPKRQSWKEQFEMVKALNRLLGGVDLTEGGGADAHD